MLWRVATLGKGSYDNDDVDDDDDADNLQVLRIEPRALGMAG